MLRDELHIKIEQLEKSNRIHRMLIILLCLLVLSIALSGNLIARNNDIAAKTVLAEEFVLLDSQGATIGTWKSEVNAGDQGFPALSMKRKDYETKLSPHSMLFYSDNNPIARLYMNDTSLGIRDKNNKTRLLMDQSGLSLHDETENTQVLLGATGDDRLRRRGSSVRGNAGLIILNENGGVAFMEPK